jgi:hypothetical protein
MSVCLSIRLSARTDSITNEYIFVQFDIGEVSAFMVCIVTDLFSFILIYLVCENILWYDQKLKIGL